MEGSYDLYFGSIWPVLDAKAAQDQVVTKIREPAQINAVALKAYARIVESWALSLKEAANLADMSESIGKRAKKPDLAGELTKDQLLRSAR